jgi:hypothetical protein
MRTNLLARTTGKLSVRQFALRSPNLRRKLASRVNPNLNAAYACGGGSRVRPAYSMSAKSVKR